MCGWEKARWWCGMILGVFGGYKGKKEELFG